MPDSDHSPEAAEAPAIGELGAVLESFRPRLRRMVSLRMDPKIRARLDPSDVLQEAYLEVSRRLPEYRSRPDLPFYLWVRFLTGQKLLEIHRRHLGAKKRDLHREVPLDAFPAANSESLSSAFFDQGLSPSGEARFGEAWQRLTEGLEKMGDTDREILALRHFEKLENREVARILDLSESAASRRYTAALRQLQAIVSQEDQP